MTIAATEPQGKQIEHLVRMLSESPVFQARLNTSDPADVLPHIKRTLWSIKGGQVESDPQLWQFPFAVVQRGDLSSRKTGRGRGPNLIYGGSMRVLFGIQSAFTSADDQEQDCANFADGVIFDLTQASGGGSEGTNVNINATEIELPLTYMPMEAPIGRHWQVEYRIEWGIV